MAKRLCPSCGGNEFIAFTKRYAKVSINENGEFEVLKEKDTIEEFEIVKCANPNCKENLTLDQLKEEIVCASCGEVVDSVNENGLCPACAAIKNLGIDTSNMSQTELLRHILANSAVKDSFEGAMNKPKENKQEITATPATEEVQEQTEEKKPRRRRKVLDAVPVETPVEEPAVEEPVQEEQPEQPSFPEPEDQQTTAPFPEPEEPMSYTDSIMEDMRTAAEEAEDDDTEGFEQFDPSSLDVPL